jgi:CelD/BcsL family acetyltransferase involved in cellulose biosynthesis
VELLDPYSREAAALWQRLPCSSYFLSWGWIENWLACLPANRAPHLGVLGASALFLGRTFEVRRRVVPTRRWHLNTSGVERLDELMVEYNGVAGADLPLDDLVRALPGRWDELALPGLRAGALGGLVDGARAAGCRVRVDRRVPAHRIDLARVRAAGDYLAVISSQTRAQIRRARRAFGDLALDVAASPAAAVAIYDELVALHGAQWRARGKPGAFADPWIDRFHRRLISRRFDAGEIQLVRVRARATGATVGCLYNFVWRGDVLQYQSGFPLLDDARAKSGFVCHAAAIEHAAAAGLATYDLLAGDVRYKASLGTDVAWLTWGTVQRPRLRFALEDRLVAAVRRRRQPS